jgi:DNA-binding protein H-NS
MSIQDLSNLSLAELRELQTKIVAAIKERQTTERTQAIQSIQAVAKSVGMSVADLLGDQKSSKKGSGTKSGPVAAKFRHPTDEAMTWSGRGRVPLWLKELEESGSPRESFLIQPA